MKTQLFALLIDMRLVVVVLFAVNSLPSATLRQMNGLQVESNGFKLMANLIATGSST